MKGMVLAMALVLLMGSVGWAADATPSGIGKTVTLTDLDGSSVQFQQAYFPNTMGQNQAVVRINKITQVYDPNTRRWHMESQTLYVNDKSGDGWGNKLVPAVGGGLANSVPLGASIVWGAKILRPTQVNQTNTGGNTGPVTTSTGAVTTTQNQTQTQTGATATATGGAGGSVNVNGGISGGTTDISNSAVNINSPLGSATNH